MTKDREKDCNFLYLIVQSCSPARNLIAVKYGFLKIVTTVNILSSRKFIIIELILMLHYWLCVKTTLKSIIHIFFSFLLLRPFVLAKISFKTFLCSQLKRNTTSEKKRNEKQKNSQDDV